MSDDLREHFESARIPSLALEPEAVLAGARRRRRTRRMIQGGALTAALATAAAVIAAVGLRATPLSQGLLPATRPSASQPTSPPATTATAIPTVYPTSSVATVTASAPTSPLAPSTTTRPSAQPNTTRPAARRAPTHAAVVGSLGDKVLLGMGFNSHGDRVWAEAAADGSRVVRFEQAKDANLDTWLANVEMTLPPSGVSTLHYGTGRRAEWPTSSRRTDPRP